MNEKKSLTRDGKFLIPCTPQERFLSKKRKRESLQSMEIVEDFQLL
jgi:hypothetical protein